MRLRSLLRQGGVGGEDDGGDGEPEQRRQDGLHLREEDGQQDAEEAVEAHLRHGAGQQDGRAGGGFRVGGGQPGVERDQRDLDGEAEEGAEEDEEGEVVRSEAVPGEVGRQQRASVHRSARVAASSMKSKLWVARKIARKDSSMATLPTMV